MFKPLRAFGVSVTTKATELRWAGVALFNNLKERLSDGEDIQILHRLESVKILPPHGENPPELYGAITEQAVALAKIASPNAERAIRMAITSSEYGTIDGSPISWSGAVDNITSRAEGSGTKRLFFISAGNVDPSELKEIGFPLQCFSNSVNMIIQDEMQPYEKSDGSAHMREMHLHTIPWPTEVLQSLGDVEVELRVILSYFVEPDPWRKRLERSISIPVS